MANTQKIIGIIKSGEGIFRLDSKGSWHGEDASIVKILNSMHKPKTHGLEAKMPFGALAIAAAAKTIGATILRIPRVSKSKPGELD